MKTLGGSINNCICIQSTRAGPRILVGNNDETVKVVSVPDMTVTTTIPAGKAVNYMAVSHDQRWMACVSDGNDLLMYDVEAEGQYRLQGVLKMEDSGFGLSWNESSTLLAAGSQDGTINIWDVRSAKLVTRLKGTQDLPKGAIRNVKFSRGGSVDLLAYSEHTSVVNLVDSRMWGAQDLIRVAPSRDIDVNISGLAFTPGSRGLVVGLEAGVLEYRIDVNSRHCFPQGALL